MLQANVDGWFYGRPKYVYTLSKLLLNNDVDCKVVGGSSSFERELEKSSVTNIRICQRWKRLDRSLCSIINLYRVIKNEKPDLIHSHGITENIIVGVIGSLLKIPIVATYHTDPFNRYKNERSIVKRIKRYVYELIYIRLLTKMVSRNFAYITVVSGAMKKSFVQYGFEENKTRVVYCGADIVDTSIKYKMKKHKRSIIVFVGRVIVDKGCDCLLRACKIIADRRRDFKLYLIGDGDVIYFEDMAKKLGIKRRVVFTGFQRDLREFLLKGDFFVLPSRGEGLPISMLEAMAYGLPIIATNVGGISEVINDGENGYLVPPDDEISLANAIDRMIDIGSKERYIMGQKNKEKIKKIYSTRIMVKDYLDIYEKSIYNTALND